MRGSNVSDLGFLHCLSEGNKLDPSFGLCADFSVYRFAPSLLPMSDFGSVNHIRPPFDFDLPLQTVIWMIALSLGVTESFHLKNGFCALAYVSRGKKCDHIQHLKQACSTSRAMRATSANCGLRVGSKVQYI